MAYVKSKRTRNPKLRNYITEQRHIKMRKVSCIEGPMDPQYNLVSKKQEQYTCKANDDGEKYSPDRSTLLIFVPLIA